MNTPNKPQNSPSEQIWAITRTFQKGAVFTGDQYANPWEVESTVPPVQFNAEDFAKKTTAIKTLLKLQGKESPTISRLYVCICGDQKSDYSEELNSQKQTPSSSKLQEALGAELDANGCLMLNGVEIVPYVVTDNWGKNAGSVTPLNHCIAEAQKAGIRKVLTWSPEITLTTPMVLKMMEHMTQENLLVVGYLRESWFKTISWRFPQNTCALWNLAQLKEEPATPFFSPVCNGDDLKKVKYINNDGQPAEANRAGMEEFEKYLRLLKAAKKANPTASHPWGLVRWGMVGMDLPAKWDQNGLTPAVKALSDIKIARQKFVMDAWVKQIFPAIHPEEIYAHMFIDAKFK